MGATAVALACLVLAMVVCLVARQRRRSEANAMQCAKTVLELVRPGDIVLIHDDHLWIAPILDVVLPALAVRQDFFNTQ